MKKTFSEISVDETFNRTVKETILPGIHTAFYSMFERLWKSNDLDATQSKELIDRKAAQLEELVETAICKNKDMIQHFLDK